MTDSEKDRLIRQALIKAKNGGHLDDIAARLGVAGGTTYLCSIMASSEPLNPIDRGMLEIVLNL